MKESLKKYKYLASRRVLQIVILMLFLLGNAYGIKVLSGNLSSARAINTLPLSDPFAVLQGLAAGSSPASDAVTGAIIVFMFYAILGGRVFCGWVCPVNIISDSANKLREIVPSQLRWKSWDIPTDVRYWVLALSIVLSAFLGVSAFEWVSPIGALHRGIIYGMGYGWLFVLLVFLFDFLAVKNGFCGHVCPLGGFYSLIGRLGFLRIGHEKDRCTLCMKCLNICPEKQVLGIIGQRSGYVLSGECVNCGRCVEVCDDRALKFGSIYSKKIDIKRQEGGNYG